MDLETKMTILRSFALCLARGVKRQRLLGGNPMNKNYCCLFLSILECLHNYATVVIELFMC